MVACMGFTHVGSGCEGCCWSMSIGRQRRWPSIRFELGGSVHAKPVAKHGGSATNSQQCLLNALWIKRQMQKGGCNPFHGNAQMAQMAVCKTGVGRFEPTSIGRSPQGTANEDWGCACWIFTHIYIYPMFIGYVPHHWWMSSQCLLLDYIDAMV